MRLREFIKKLKKLAREHGDAEVVMADSIPVVSPIFFEKYPDKRSVVITDQE